MRVLIWDSWILFYLPQFLLALVSPCFGFYMLQLLPASISTFFGIYSNPSSRRQSFNLGCIRHLVWNNHWLSRRINWCIRTSSTWSEEWCRKMFLGRRCRKWRDWEWNQSSEHAFEGLKSFPQFVFFFFIKSESPISANDVYRLASSERVGHRETRKTIRRIALYQSRLI